MAISRSKKKNHTTLCAEISITLQYNYLKLNISELGIQLYTTYWKIAVFVFLNEPGEMRKFYKLARSARYTVDHVLWNVLPMLVRRRLDPCRKPKWKLHHWCTEWCKRILYRQLKYFTTTNYSTAMAWWARPCFSFNVSYSDINKFDYWPSLCVFSFACLYFRHTYTRIVFVNVFSLRNMKINWNWIEIIIIVW